MGAAASDLKSDSVKVGHGGFLQVEQLVRRVATVALQTECVVVDRFAPQHVGHAALVSSEQQFDVHSLGGGAVCRAS
eukprot:6226588-Prymnesium_polylepis.1